jgi:hypothetical protein
LTVPSAGLGPSIMLPAASYLGSIQLAWPVPAVIEAPTVE